MMVRKKDRASVLPDLYWSLLNKQPVPQHVADAFVASYLKGRNGEIRSWDEVFGRPNRFRTGKKIERQIEQEHLVLDEVERLKAGGEPLNEEEFEAIGRRIAVGGKSKVKELLRGGR